MVSCFVHICSQKEINEPRHEKNRFAYAKTKALISCAVTAQISAFAFALRIVQHVYFLNPKFKASSLLLRLYRPVGVGPGQKSQSLVFSHRCSNKRKMKTKNDHLKMA